MVHLFALKPAPIVGNWQRLKRNRFKNGYSLWILAEQPPRPTTVREIANLLLMRRGSTPVQTVGKNWVTNFVKRHSELSTRFSRRYNYERAKCEDPKIIQEWFNCVQHTILQYGIDPDDIYNFDETGFAMGLTATAKVITRSEYYGRWCRDPFYNLEIMNGSLQLRQ